MERGAEGGHRVGERDGVIALRCIAGFLLQMLPCAALCLIPFARRFTVSARRAYALAGSVLLVFGVVFVVAGVMPLDASVRAYRAFIANVVFMAALVALCGVYVRVVRARMFQKVFVLLVVASYGCLAMYITDTANRLLNSTYMVDDYMYKLPTLVVLSVVTAVSFPFMVLLMRNLGRLIDRVEDDDLWKTMCFPPAGLLAVALLGSWMPLNLNMSYQTVNELLCVALIALGLVFAWWFARLLSRMDREVAERERLAAEARGYRRLAQNADELRRMRHDVGHQLQVIDAYLDRGDAEGARRYIGKAAEEVALLPGVMYCRNPLVNAILADYDGRARAAGAVLACEVSAPENVGVGDVDLCRLLANMLDNAVAGCRAVAGVGDAAEPVIRFTFRQEGEFLFSACDNPCSEASLRRRGARFASTKPDARHGGHGLGLSIMADIAEAYQGGFECEVRDGRFWVRANLCIRKETDPCTV